MNARKRGRLNEANLSREEMSRILEYDELCCALYWKVNRRGTAKAGSVAGWTDTEGYRRVRINGIAFSAHRLIWLLVHGVWPDGEIDHINGRRDDNDPANLREVSRQENMQNQKLRVTNTSGTMGVCFYARSQKWLAQIRVDDRRIHLGYFRFKTSAIIARRRAERKYQFHPNHGRS